MQLLLELEGITRKSELLRSLRSSGKHQYKRYNNLPLRYAGGKSLAVGYVVEQIPEGINKIGELHT